MMKQRKILFLTVLFIGFVILTIRVKAGKALKDGLDYKQPFVTFYGDEYHRGSYYHHYLKKECTNLPSQYDDWASSVNTYHRCVYLCELKDCEGKCERVHGPGSNAQNRMTTIIGLNDKVSSVKFCYTFAERAG